MGASINRKIQPKIQPVRTIDLIAPVHFKLENGLQLYLLNLGTQDLVKIELVFTAGLAYQNQKLVSFFTNKMLAEGTSSFTAFEIAEKFDSLGAYFNTNIDKDYASVTLYCLTKHLDQILPVFAEIVCEPTFPENELQILTNKTKQEFIINLKKVKSIAQLNFPPLIFGPQHPYGQKAEIRDFNNVSQNDVQTFYKNYYLNGDSSLFISGKINERIIKKLKNSFSRYPIKLNVIKPVPDFSAKPNPELTHHIEVTDALQSAIWVGKKLFDRLDPDFIGMQVLNTILGGYFGSRLMSNIREEKGYTYGIGSSIVSYKNDGYFAIQTEVGGKHTSATLTEIYHEINVLQTKSISNIELDLVKNYIIGQLIRGMDGPFAVHDKLKTVVLFNFDMNYYQQFINEVLAITPETIKQLATKHLKKESLTELIVGK